MPDFKDTPEWHLGRRGEMLTLAIMLHFGFRLIDVSGTTRNRAPLVHQKQFSYVAPDALALKTAIIGAEFKTKWQHFEWAGGSRSDPVKVPRRMEEGVDARNYRGYLQFEHEWQCPVVLFFLAIREGELIANTLRSLGEPRQSPNPDWDLVNWPVYKFRRIASFDTRNLRRFMFSDWREARPRVPRPAPDDIPPERALLQAVQWLRPQQGELDLIMQDVVAQIERDWHTP